MNAVEHGGPRPPSSSAAVSPASRREFAAGLASALPADAVTELLEPRLAVVFAADADCVLSFRLEDRASRLVVGWRLTVREPAPGLGTWWVSGEEGLPVEASERLGARVGDLITAELRRYRRGSGA